MEKKDLYDIKQYTESELYEILDLTNPTDRELEAKILMMIHKYENSSAKSSKKLLQFFENIYSHFEKGKNPMQAALDGTMEVITPVFTSVLTTVFAFSSL